MNKKPQIFFIHGAESFKTYNDYLEYLKNRKISIDKWFSWRDKYLDEKIGKDFEIIRPRFPNPDNARYLEWKINFERYIPFLKNGVILIGSSMGAVFLAKYLSEHKFPKKLSAVFLVAPPYSNKLAGDYYGGGFNLKADLSLISKNCHNVNFLFSEDDNVVPLIHSIKYAEKLPKVNIVVLKNKNGHFRVEKFPEIVRMIKMLIKK